MPIARRLLAFALAGGLAGCATHQPCPPTASGNVAGQNGLPDWHDVITNPDHVRLRNWREALVASLASARASGFGKQIDAEGPLLDPDVALDDATVPVDHYRCRFIKLGSIQPGHANFVAYPAHRCEVRPSGRLTRLIELNGLQKPSGRLYPDGPSRMIFLGTMVLGDEKRPINYGRDPDRDLVGSVQRVGEKRWRMLLPRPAWESVIDVLEFVPEG